MHNKGMFFMNAGVGYGKFKNFPEKGWQKSGVFFTLLVHSLLQHSFAEIFTYGFSK